ncbi:MAG: hypothetical protein AB7V77_02895 [Candidatus Woesearchaeota archaeon]
MKKGQSAMEFVILLTFMILVFSGFFLVIQTKILDVSESNEKTYLKELNNIVLNEVDLASTSKPDYHHPFNIPTNIKGKTYLIEILDNQEIVTLYENYEQINFLTTNITGPIYIGKNVIHKLDGIVFFKTKPTEYHENFQGIFINVNPEMCYIRDQTYVLDDWLCDIYEDSFTLEYRQLCQDLFNLCVP